MRFVCVSDCLVKVLYCQVDVIVVCKVKYKCRFFWVCVGMGKWSEERTWDVCQVDPRAMLGEASEISVDVGFVFMLWGLRVGELVLLSIVCERSCGSWALGSPRINWFCSVSKWLSCGVFLWGMMMLGECIFWWSWCLVCVGEYILIVCSSSVSSAVMCSSVCVYCLGVLVKLASLCINVISPPPSPVVLSFQSVVYPGNLGVLCLSLSLVSWMAAMCLLCCSRWCLSFCILFVIPSMLCCSMFSFVMICVCWLGGGVGGLEG